MSDVRWPWRRRTLPAPPDIPVHLEESRQALDKARQDLADTHARDRQISRTVATLRRIRAENDFATTIRNALKP